MRRIGFARPLAAGVFAALLAAVAGCPTSGTKSSPPQPQTPSPQPPAGEQIPLLKLPAAEFQQPPALPPVEPLPKLAQEPVDSSLPAAAEGQRAQGGDFKTISNPLEPANPLRDQGQPGAGNPLADKSADKAAERPRPPTGRPATAKNSSEPFDPIKVNGRIFKGWPKPKVAIVITGAEEGYIEPCGCAGLDRMKGGMSRRYTFLRQLRKDGWPVVALDVGGLAHGFGRQAELKFQTLVEGKRKMDYDAIAFGADDLRLPAGELVSVAASVDGKPGLFVSANVGLFGFAAEITPQTRIVAAGGMKIGVTAVLGKKYQQEIHNSEIEMSDPDAALAKIVPELKRKADYLVLLAHATIEESAALAKKFPEFNAVVTSDGPPEPPAMPEIVPGTKTLLITVGYKGMNAIVLGLYNDPKQPFRYQRVPLDSRFANSPEMKMLMAGYQDQLKAIGFAGLGLRPVPHPLVEVSGKFAGSQKCQPCHEKSYDIWKKSGHAHAYDTLAKLDPPRNFDPECVSCHVVGWNPGKFFPYKFGYESREKTPELINVGCEDCHGPGKKHCVAEVGANEELQKKLRKALVITKAESKKQQCVNCHDLDNSPDFEFDLYWPFVEHHEKE